MLGDLREAVWVPGWQCERTQGQVFHFLWKVLDDGDCWVERNKKNRATQIERPCWKCEGVCDGGDIPLEPTEMAENNQEWKMRELTTSCHEPLVFSSHSPSYFIHLSAWFHLPIIPSPSVSTEQHLPHPIMCCCILTIFPILTVLISTQNFEFYILPSQVLLDGPGSSSVGCPWFQDLQSHIIPKFSIVFLTFSSAIKLIAHQSHQPQSPSFSCSLISHKWLLRLAITHNLHIYLWHRKGNQNWGKTSNHTANV